MSRDKTSSERAPLCPICAERHWGREPHVFGKSKPPPGEPRVPIRKPNRKPVRKHKRPPQ
jgi:hypothetical protein